MARRAADITTPDGVADVQLFTPDGAGPWPAVIIYTDAFGVRAAYEGMAERLAADGYAALLPNPYYRASRAPVQFPPGSFADAPVREALMKVMGQLTPEATRKDVGAFLDWLDAQPEVLKGKAAIIGHCMSGAIALRAAGDFPERIAAAASFHGGNLATDDPSSPDAYAGLIKSPLLICHASDDPFMPPEMQQRLHAALDAAGVDYEAEVYKARHGWCIPGSPVYDEGEAERARVRLLALLEKAYV